MLIAHPPCTYLSNIGARHLYAGGNLNKERYKQGLEAKDFFLQFYNASVKKICVENPIPSKVFELPPYTQIIQPYEYGHRESKKTCLWLKGLEPLKPTHVTEPPYTTLRSPNSWYNKGGVERQRNRSKTFKGIAEAMAWQWGGVINEYSNARGSSKGIRKQTD